jgi:hypothetical protein
MTAQRALILPASDLLTKPEEAYEKAKFQHVRPARQNDRFTPSAPACAIAKVLHFQASAESVLKSVYEFLCKIATNSY